MAIIAHERVALSIAHHGLVEETVTKLSSHSPYLQVFGHRDNRTAWLISSMRNAQIFDITNVDSWLYDTQPSLRDMTTLTGCIPPYPYTYFEWPHGNTGVHQSLLLNCSDRGNDGDRSIFALTFLSETERSRPAHFFASYVFFLNADGCIFTDDDGMPHIHAEVVPIEHPRDIKEKVMLTSITMALFTCSLLNCRNVKAVDVQPVLSRQQRRALDRKGKDPLVYKVLQVSPIHKLRQEGDGPAGEGAKRRLHWCRGHFAEYGPKYQKGLLFGRMEGRFWIPPTVKGSLDEGVVDKTYKLAPASIART